MSYSHLDVSQLLDVYRSGVANPTEVVSSLIDRINHLDPQLNAITELLDDATSQATAATEAWQTGATEGKPLLGVPVLVKEKHRIRGKVVDQAVPATGVESSEDHPIVARLRQAGAIVLGRTTNPEFCAATFTDSIAHGPTKNPWNTTCSPGGSSGGSGAALAAGFAPLATGSDIGGSTRIPASLCGVVGYKAPYGVVPGDHPSTMDWYRSDSAMARTVSDTLLMHNIIAGQHRNDPHSLPQRPIVPTRATGKRIGISFVLGDYNVCGVQINALEELQSQLEQDGFHTTVVNPHWSTEELITTSLAHFGHILAPTMANAIEESNATVSDYVVEFISAAMEHARRIPLFKTFEMETRIRREILNTMNDVDVLITPTTCKESYQAEAISDSFDHDGMFYWKDYLTIAFNIANRHPVLSVPSGVSPDGFPLGVQIVGQPYDEGSVFDIGMHLEGNRPWDHPFTR
ncbi:Acylamidase [Corynebacterium kalinowskii]|uniref:Acylamidase n=1 Tax=Corynebacterium kalinowskii TaxID=2675216 RepID=A0A6B8VW39_9CORY|nr:amidase [Corynebacterium kalinowskii]QGU01530.1 Acylamidase [Corynebacterium kalinowskii]